MSKTFKSLFAAAAALVFCFSIAQAQQAEIQPEEMQQHPEVQQQQPEAQQQPPHSPGQHKTVSPDEISDSELKKFINASGEIEPIQKEASNKIENIVKEEDMDINRFQQILAAGQNPEIANRMEIEEEEIRKVENMRPGITEVHEEARLEMIETITECGLTIERFEDIYISLRQHPELVQRLENLLSQRQP